MIAIGCNTAGIDYDASAIAFDLRLRTAIHSSLIAVNCAATPTIG
jgi:hypothetical protein